MDLTASSHPVIRTRFSRASAARPTSCAACFRPAAEAILALQSHHRDGQVSRMVPFLKQGRDDHTLNRADIHYVVTKYGIAHIHKASASAPIDPHRHRAPGVSPARSSRSAQAEPGFGDQGLVPGEHGSPEHLERCSAGRAGATLLLRGGGRATSRCSRFLPLALGPGACRRFMTPRRDMPSSGCQEFVVIDCTRRMMLLATVEEGAQPADRRDRQVPGRQPHGQRHLHRTNSYKVTSGRSCSRTSP